MIFNNPAGQEGYETILSSSLKLQDSFIEAKETKGTYTVGPGIDGWTDNQVPLQNRLRLCKSRMGHPASTCHF